MSFRDLLRKRRAEAHRGSLHRPTQQSESLFKVYRDTSCPAEGLLSGGRLPSGLRSPSSQRSLYKDQRSSQSEPPARDAAGAVREINADQGLGRESTRTNSNRKRRWQRLIRAYSRGFAAYLLVVYCVLAAAICFSSSERNACSRSAT